MSVYKRYRKPAIGETFDGEYCYCRLGKSSNMIECGNKNCIYDGYFHDCCVGLNEVEYPWYCSKMCENYSKKTVAFMNVNDLLMIKKLVIAPTQYYQNKQLCNWYEFGIPVRQLKLENRGYDCRAWNIPIRVSPGSIECIKKIELLVKSIEGSYRYICDLKASSNTFQIASGGCFVYVVKNWDEMIKVNDLCKKFGRYSRLYSCKLNVHYIKKDEQTQRIMEISFLRANMNGSEYKRIKKKQEQKKLKKQLQVDLQQKIQNYRREPKIVHNNMIHKNVNIMSKTIKKDKVFLKSSNSAFTEYCKINHIFN